MITSNRSRWERLHHAIGGVTLFQHRLIGRADRRLAACPDTGLNLDIIGEVLYLVSG